MPITKKPFGHTANNQTIDLFTLDNGNGLVAKIINFGGRITELHTPDRTGRTQSIVLGFDALEPYLNLNPFFGTLVGRFANRIAKGQFNLDGKHYQIPINNGPNALHGGPVGFDKLLWTATPSDASGTPTLTLKLSSPDGDMGFPGTMDVTVVYSLISNNELQIAYTATTDKPTVLNLTNHSYFNLAGPGTGTILDHQITINATHYTPVKSDLIPTGEIAPVANTPFDFTKPHAIAERINQVDNGYDHNFVLTQKAPFAARVTEEKSGRVMEVTTDQPGIQFYSGGFLNGSITGIGGAYPRFGGLCLETQHFPDSPNQPRFPSTVLRPGQTFASTTRYRFSTL